MTNSEMIAEYYAALEKLEKRHARLQAEIRVYDKRIVLLEEEMDEIWEVIAALKKHEQGDKYGWRNSGVSAGYRGKRIPGVLEL